MQWYITQFSLICHYFIILRNKLWLSINKCLILIWNTILKINRNLESKRDLYCQLASGAFTGGDFRALSARSAI